MMELKIAELSDIEATLTLHYKYQVDSIAEEDKADGFVTTPFTKEQLTELITAENGLFIAKDGDMVLAYVMAASWGFWSAWPMFAHMITGLPNLTYAGQSLSTENSYQYGPICVDKCVRGSGMVEQIFEFSKQAMAERYPIMVTFINKNNPRSYAAHTRKLGMELIQEFEYNDNHYYELVCSTGSHLS